MKNKKQKGHPFVGSCQAQKTSLARKEDFFRVINFDDNRDLRVRVFVTDKEGYAYRVISPSLAHPLVFKATNSIYYK
jgi:hypothetical protein